MTRRRYATLRQVADHAGVSIATASRALNGLAVTEESLRRTRTAADELGYVPNGAARSLHTSRTMAVAIVVPSLTTLSSILVESIAGVLDSAGYTLLAATALNGDDRYDVILERLLERRIDAVFCVQPPMLSGILSRYQNAGVPIVALLQRAEGQTEIPLMSVRFDKPAEQIFQRLHALGHRTGAVVFRHAAADQARQYRAAAGQAGVDIQLVDSGAPEGSASRLIDCVCSGSDPFTFIVANYSVALQIDEEAARRGLHVPGDLSIVAVAAEPGAEHRPHPLSSLHVDFHEFGVRSARKLLAWLDGDAPCHSQSLDLSKWVERKSTGPARTR